MVAKTVYELHWKPSLATIIVSLLVAVAVVYIPYFLKQPLFINPLLGVTAQLAFCVGVILFFYNGIERLKQFQIVSVMILAVSLFGILSNVFYEATFLVSSKMLASDYVVLALINLGGVAVTLSCYRISQKKVEVIEGAIEPGAKKYPMYQKLTPLVYLAPVAAFSAIMMNSRYIPNGEVFVIAIPFFIAAQTVLNVGGAFFVFKEKTRVEKLRLASAVVAFAMLYGTIGNAINHLTVLRPGGRLALNSNEFIVFNAGALVTVLTIVNWNKFLSTAKAAYEKYLVAQSGIPAASTEPAAQISAEAPAEKISTEKPEPVAVAAAQEESTAPAAEEASEKTAGKKKKRSKTSQDS